MKRTKRVLETFEKDGQQIEIHAHKSHARATPAKVRCAARPRVARIVDWTATGSVMFEKSEGIGSAFVGRRNGRRV